MVLLVHIANLKSKSHCDTVCSKYSSTTTVFTTTVFTTTVFTTTVFTTTVVNIFITVHHWHGKHSYLHDRQYM